MKLSQTEAVRQNNEMKISDDEGDKGKHFNYTFT